MKRCFSILVALITALLPGAASAQGAPASVIIVPPLSTPENVQTPSGWSGVIARQVADVIAADLRSTAELVPLGPENARVYPHAEATAPSFREWRKTGAKSLVTGFVQVRPDGRLTVACYLHDIAGGREVARKGFVVAAGEWRRAAHRCSDTIYLALTKRPGSFDTRIAYVAESGPKSARVKRIAIMDSDGTQHRYLTGGDSTVLTPRQSPDGERLAYVSFAGGQSHIRLVDLTSNDDRPLLPGNAMSFAPSFSSDGRRLVFSMAIEGNTDIYTANAHGGGLQRLTSTPGIDTSPSFSPDGTRIVFESDRSGTPQIYTMNSDGSEQRRVSFGGANYQAPAWSPDGELIAFTRRAGDGLRVGVMSATGASERVLTRGPDDEAPSWGASGRDLLFQRTEGTRTAIYSVSVDGGEGRRITTPQDASDPHWSISGAAR
jgi:TolB protein